MTIRYSFSSFSVTHYENFYSHIGNGRAQSLKFRIMGSIQVFIPVTRIVKGYTGFVGEYVTGKCAWPTNRPKLWLLQF